MIFLVREGKKIIKKKKKRGAEKKQENRGKEEILKNVAEVEQNDEKVREDVLYIYLGNGRK